LFFKSEAKVFLRKINLSSFLISIALIFIFSFLPAVFLIPQKIEAESWLMVDENHDKVWVDTSHWEKKQVFVKSGYFKDNIKKRWVDSSYVVYDGYWETGSYRVWINSSSVQSYAAYRYIDTSHYVTEYYYSEVYKPVNFTVIKGTDSYGWSVYSFAAKAKGMQQVTYNGSRYLANVYVIDYRPARGGSIQAVKYVFLYKAAMELRSRKVWISSGYWQAYTAYRQVDTSHWETRTERHWVDTSYKVERGYWEEYSESQWVDTSHYEYSNIFVSSGYRSEPVHGKITVEKSPEYVFTRWHKGDDGENCGMELKISWEIDNSGLLPEQDPQRIKKVYVYQDTERFKGLGSERTCLYDNTISPVESGSVSIFSEFDYAGNEESLCHIYLFTEEGQSVHAFFSNPVNGFISININYDGTSRDADCWLGGNSFGQSVF